MPYIPQSDRAAFEEQAKVIGKNATTAGELNFAISRILAYYLGIRETSYETYNQVIGVLESVKQELYRRLVALYETDKWAKNGDVYGVDLTPPSGRSIVLSDRMKKEEE